MKFRWKVKHTVVTLPCLGLSLIALSNLKSFSTNPMKEGFLILNTSILNCPVPLNTTEFNKFTDLALALHLRNIEEEQRKLNFTRVLYSYSFFEWIFKKPERKKLFLIFATWRSGSSFLGELLASHPAMYYHFEPLMYLGSAQVKNDETLEKDGIPLLLDNLLNCRYTANHNLPMFGQFNKTQTIMNYRNPSVWKYCSCDSRLCENSPFIERLCGIFPFQTMKLVRLRLSVSERFLNDATNKVKIVHLVRDPRAIWVSRQPHSWCRLNADCWDVKRLCKHMVDDYYSYLYLKEIYPEKVFLVKFEELSLNPEMQTKNLMHNLGLTFHPLTQKFIQTHTRKRRKKTGNAFDTFRNSSSVVFAWKDYFKGKEEELNVIEKHCKGAMRLWNYA